MTLDVLQTTFREVFGPHVLANEATVALVAVVRFLVRVSIHVVLQVVPIRELPVTYIALEFTAQHVVGGLDVGPKATVPFKLPIT